MDVVYAKAGALPTEINEYTLGNYNKMWLTSLSILYKQRNEVHHAKPGL